MRYKVTLFPKSFDHDRQVDITFSFDNLEDVYKLVDLVMTSVNNCMCQLLKESEE